MINKIIQGNCIEVLKKVESGSIDLVYLDPPFFTQKKHTLTSKDNKRYQFSDHWDSLQDFLKTIESSLQEIHRILKETGSVFLHCDKTASHHFRIVLDEVFGAKNFQSEIIWTYKRWSNSKKGLLNNHQTIFFYSKTDQFKFNTIYTDYSATTNIDQILQDRVRDTNGKTVYKLDANGKAILTKGKKGVPLSDVWNIPYLNPKAKERVGYPTQKPVSLLKRIISITTDKDDIVLDPFCGSGTTCVAAKCLDRNYIGIDISDDAVFLAEKRLEEMIISESNLLKKGSAAYLEKNKFELAILASIDATAVQRNTGIDGFLKKLVDNKPVPVKIQSKDETLEKAILKLEKATKGKDYPLKIVVQTKGKTEKTSLFPLKTTATIIKSPELLIQEALKNKK